MKMIVDGGLVPGTWVRAHPVYRELRAVLKEIEWSGSGGAERCPMCRKDKIFDHTPDCRLAKYLEET